MSEKKTLNDILHLFQSISGMNIAVYDRHLNYVASCLFEDDVCSLLHRSSLCLDRCLKSDIDALSLVAKTQKPYIYSCPFGFFEAIFPIISHGSVIGYIIIGPAVTDGKTLDSELIECIIKAAPELDTDEIRRAVLNVPHRSEGQLHAFCDVLDVFSEYVENHTLLISQSLTLGQQIKRYVKNNLTKKITLEKLSISLHCNTVTLTETFRREFGITIMQYVQQMRMERATYLLSTSDKSVSEIAELCGIPQTDYFSKCFKSYFGLSPTDWRKKEPSCS